MAIINKTAVKELKTIYLRKYGKHLDDKEATERAISLMHLFLVLFSKNPEKLVKELF